MALGVRSIRFFRGIWLGFFLLARQEGTNYRIDDRATFR